MSTRQNPLQSEGILKLFWEIREPRKGADLKIQDVIVQMKRTNKKISTLGLRIGEIIGCITVICLTFIYCVQPAQNATLATEQTESVEPQEQRLKTETRPNRFLSAVAGMTTPVLDKNDTTVEHNNPTDNESVITKVGAEITKQREGTSVAMEKLIADIDAKITEQREDTARQIKEIIADIDVRIAKQKMLSWITLVLVIISYALQIFLQYFPHDAVRKDSTHRISE